MHCGVCACDILAILARVRVCLCVQPRAPAAETSPTFRPPPVPSDTPELLARFQKMNKDGDDNDSGAAQ